MVYQNQKNPYKSQKQFEFFYEDLFQEMSFFGDIDNIYVCDNLSDHLIGNVYVKFLKDKSAMKALKSVSD